ncbi:SdrD B-like domain-containing protein [Saccharothrix obliqua]|uniref:SdrD B-like domain-containing protein n=1 Tax=Saccharothrix obliqua TaxID=2861747 RepID=UPI001C5CD2E0|nr:SdrD B-like domain-containing protein [Saccharothrix obliqua]MBW4719539.1 hypothetical protein [Saccharothrix obliqua]
MFAHRARRSARVPVVLALAAATALSTTSAAHADTITADVTVTAEVVGGPFLVGQEIPVRITATNIGGSTAERTYVDARTLSGSYLGLLEFGPLKYPGTAIEPGAAVTTTVPGKIYQWQGAPVVRITAWSYSDTDHRDNNTFDLAVPVTDPGSATGTLGGVVYGDRNDNNTADPGEGLAGVLLEAYDGSFDRKRTTRTDADGRYRFTDLPVRRYGLWVHEAPDGWVLPSGREVDVDGDEHVEYRAVRPLSDRLTAKAQFRQDTHQVGDRAEVVITLTNTGTTDITGIKAGCDRSGGEGPHLVDLRLGDLEWQGPGVTVPAGAKRKITISGVVPDKATGFGSTNVGCDFGPDDNPRGFPVAVDFARVPAPPADTWLAFYQDLDGDSTVDPGEEVSGVRIGLKDRISGRVVARGKTDARGHVAFTGVPAGPYEVKLIGDSWEIKGSGNLFVGTCLPYCRGGQHMTLVPAA